jgi:hypothetical protein
MCHKASFEIWKTNYSLQFRLIEVQWALNRHAEFNLMQWLELQALLTLTVTCTLRNWVVLSRAFITMCSWCTLGIGLWRNLDIICLWFVTNFRWELAGQQFSRRAETGIQIPSLFELSRWKWVHTIYSKTRYFGGPNTQVRKNVVKSALEAFWIETWSRKCGMLVSGRCQSSA